MKSAYTHPKGGYRLALFMCFLGVSFYFYEYYLRVAPSVMHDSLKQSFGLGETEFGHLAAFYYYAYTPMQVPVGVMIDRYGVRRILTAACLLCAGGAYLFSETRHLWVAQLARFVIGFGSAFAYVGVLKISNVWLPKKYFAFMAGLCSTLGMLGASSGQIVMTAMVQQVEWRQTLIILMWIGMVLSVLLWFFLRDKIDDKTDTSHNECVPIKVGSLKKILLSRQIWMNAVIGCLTFLPIVGFAETWAPDFLKAAGMTEEKAAFGSSMLFFGFAVGGPWWGFLSDKIRSRRIPLILGSFFSAIFIALVIFMPSASIGWMYPLLFLTTFFASAEILVFAVSNDIAHTLVSATAVSFTNMLTMVGGMFLPTLIGALLDDTGLREQACTTGDYSYALAVLPVALLLATGLSMMLKESYRHLSLTPR